MHRSSCMHLPVKNLCLEIPINFYSYTKSILNYNYKIYPSGVNIGADHTARLHILIFTFLFLIWWKQVYCNIPVICSHAPPPALGITFQTDKNQNCFISSVDRNDIFDLKYCIQAIHSAFIIACRNINT